MTHPYKDILIAIANGEKIQQQSMEGNWNDAGINPLFDIAKGNCPPSRYRIKPKTININGYEVPEPVREPLIDGERYFYLSYADDVQERSWSWYKSDDKLLRAGVIHKTREAAQKHLDALLSFTKLKESK